MRKQNRIEAEFEANIIFEGNVIGARSKIPQGLNVYRKGFVGRGEIPEGSYILHPCLFSINIRPFQGQEKKHTIKKQSDLSGLIG